MLKRFQSCTKVFVDFQQSSIYSILQPLRPSPSELITCPYCRQWLGYDTYDAYVACKTCRWRISFARDHSFFVPFKELGHMVGLMYGNFWITPQDARITSVVPSKTELATLLNRLVVLEYISNLKRPSP